MICCGDILHVSLLQLGFIKSSQDWKTMSTEEKMVHFFSMFYIMIEDLMVNLCL